MIAMRRMEPEIWKIFGVCIDQNTSEVLVTICPIDGNPQSDSETFGNPSRELKFWEKNMGRKFEMTSRIRKGFDVDANPTLDLEELRKHMKQTFIFR